MFDSADYTVETLLPKPKALVTEIAFHQNSQSEQKKKKEHTTCATTISGEIDRDLNFAPSLSRLPLQRLEPWMLEHAEINSNLNTATCDMDRDRGS